MNNSIHNSFSTFNQETDTNSENDLQNSIFPNDLLFMNSYDNFSYIFDSCSFFAMNQNDLNNWDNNVINPIYEDNHNEKYVQSSDKEISIVIDKNENSNLMNNTNDNANIRNDTKNMLRKKRKKNYHNKFSSDNIIIKLNRYIMNFIIILINEILNKLEKNIGEIDDFRYINGKEKKNINQCNISTIKDYTIKHILHFDNSLKYKDKNHNRELINKILNIDNSSLQKILNMKYIDIFKNYYYINKKDIIIEDLKISLPETFDDFLKKIKAKEDLRYQDKINKLIKKNLLDSNDNCNNEKNKELFKVKKNFK